VHVLVRHCFASDNSTSKQRPPTFDRIALHKQLIKSCRQKAHVTLVLDEARRQGVHFIEQEEASESVDLVLVEGGTDAKSFTALLQLVQQRISNNTIATNDILVFLEDDYLVSDDWITIVEHALSYADYATGYDHPDKYTASYSQIPCRLYYDAACNRHFRSTVSTTNSYAMRACTLLRDMSIHLESCAAPRSITDDHGKFLRLWGLSRNSAIPNRKANELLVSAIPSAWSHEEEHMQMLVQ
jgi:hypothetical protein